MHKAVSGDIWAARQVAEHEQRFREKDAEQERNFPSNTNKSADDTAPTKYSYGLHCSRTTAYSLDISVQLRRIDVSRFSGVATHNLPLRARN
jgi:hypothetical protein